MKFVAAALILLIATLSALAAPAPVSQMEKVSINGNEYIHLSDWARRNNFQSAWLSKTEFKVSNNSASMVFTVNSQKFLLNGVAVWLSSPVGSHGSSACVLAGDATSTLHPLLWPTRKRSGPRIKRICLDPGHGGKDTGNKEGKREEKTYVLQFARELAAQLRKAGYTVFSTRTWDTFVELDERPEIARRREADLFISLHFNSAGSDARGTEVFCITPPHTASTNARGEGASTGKVLGNLYSDQSIQLAYQVQKSIVTKLSMEDRGVRRARFAVLRNANMPAVLVEGAFMSNAEEAKKIYNTTWRQQLATSIVEGVKNYQRLTDPPK